MKRKINAVSNMQRIIDAVSNLTKVLIDEKVIISPKWYTVEFYAKTGKDNVSFWIDEVRVSSIKRKLVGLPLKRILITKVKSQKEGRDEIPKETRSN